MSLNRYAARTDANQGDIVEALRDAGCVVWVIKWPVDLLVGVNVSAPMQAKWLPVEVKAGAKKARQLTDDQREFIRTAGYLPVAVVTDVESALRAVKVMCNS